MFVDRQEELAFLNKLLARRRPTAAQLVLLYGRRRIGKTVLAQHWAVQSGLPSLYWAAEPENAGVQRRKLAARLLGVDVSEAPIFESWASLWTTLATQIGDRPFILMLDEVSYAAEADTAFLASLQHAWDQRFKHSRAVILLSGSHVRTMEAMQNAGSPLFGRLTGQWHLQPLPFSALREFLPGWSAEQRVAVYACFGGIPAYLEWLDPMQSLKANLRTVFAKGSPFSAEAEFLLRDEFRESTAYHTVLGAIGRGAHSLEEISNSALVAKPHLSSHLARLQEVHFVERRLPVTVPPQRTRTSHSGRYHFSDPFLNFYFSFVAPAYSQLGYWPEDAMDRAEEQLRAFIGRGAFERLCWVWLNQASRAGNLPFELERIGSHWARGVQVDAVGINWRQHAILLGECKWTADAVGRDVVDDLLTIKTDKTRQALPEGGQHWTVHHYLFTRGPLTPPARTLAREKHVEVVELKQLARDLGA